MWTVQATRSTMCPMTDQLTAGPGSGDDAIHEVSALFVVSRLFWGGFVCYGGRII